MSTLCANQEDPINTDDSQTEAFSAVSGRNSMINDPIWSGFEFIRDLIHVPLISKF